MRALELEENLRRKDLTGYEASRDWRELERERTQQKQEAEEEPLAEQRAAQVKSDTNLELIGSESQKTPAGQKVVASETQPRRLIPIVVNPCIHTG